MALERIKSPSAPTHRLRVWMPFLASMVEKPGGALLVLLALALLLSFISVHWGLAPLCLAVPLLAMRIDYALADRMIITPLVILVLLQAIGLAIGLPMIMSAIGPSYSYPHLCMQLVFICGAPFLFLGYRLGRGRLDKAWCPAQTENIFASEARSLRTIALFLMAFDIIRVTVGWRTGALDRGFAGAETAEDGGIYSYINIFSRWSNLWFFFMPFLWRGGGSAWRAGLSVVAAYYSMIAFASGSRGLLLFPLVFVVAGIYFFIDRPRFSPGRWVPLFVCIVVGYVYLADVFRNSDSFQNSRLTDIGTRLAAVRTITAGLNERQDFAVTTGSALLGVSDALVYEMTPDPVPYAGASDMLGAVLWTWVPHTLAPDKPLLWDANSIVVAYTATENDRSFSALTLSADLYRRFGWVGIPIGIFVLGLGYGIFVRAVLRIFSRVSLIAGVTFIVFLMGGIMHGLSSTVLQTWWIWAYDIPKHLIPLSIIVFLVGGNRGSGMAHYGSSFGTRNRLASVLPVTGA